MAHIGRAGIRCSFFLEKRCGVTGVRMLSWLHTHFVVLAILCHNEQLLLVLTESTDFLVSVVVNRPLGVSAVTHALLVKQFGEESTKHAVSH